MYIRQSNILRHGHKTKRHSYANEQFIDTRRFSTGYESVVLCNGTFLEGFLQ